MKALFKKRLKKLTALVVALVMMLLPGQSLMVMAAETYSVESISQYYNNHDYFNKILKPGDTITGPGTLSYMYLVNQLSTDSSKVEVYDFDTFYQNLILQAEDNNYYEDYNLLAKYFKGWMVY